MVAVSVKRFKCIINNLISNRCWRNTQIFWWRVRYLLVAKCMKAFGLIRFPHQNDKYFSEDDDEYSSRVKMCNWFSLYAFWHPNHKQHQTDYQRNNEWKYDLRNEWINQPSLLKMFVIKLYCWACLSRDYSKHYWCSNVHLFEQRAIWKWCKLNFKSFSSSASSSSDRTI